MTEAQDIQRGLTGTPCCSVPAELYDGVGMVCTGCGAVVAALEPLVPAAADPIASTLATIVPDEQQTPDGIAERIADCNARLERGMAFHRQCIEDRYRTATDYTNAYAHAILAAAEQGGAADVRRAAAEVATEPERDAAKLAELKLKALEATTHDLRAMLSGYQSMLRAIQSTYESAGQAERYNERRGRAF